MRPFVLALALLLPSLAFADLPVTTAIDEVTVHPGSARVVRKGRVQVPAGSVRLLLEGLTPQLQDDSLRLDARGSAAARLLGVSAEIQPQAESTSPQVRAAEKELLDREMADRALADELAVAEQQKSFLDALRATYAKERAENLPSRRVDTAEWSKAIDFLGTRYAEVHRRIREVTRRRTELAGELEAARRRLEQLRARGHTSYKRVVVDLLVDRPGSLELELTYLVEGAGWDPLWNARLDPGRRRIELGLQAQVVQTTGEAWENVRLAVSSARPERHVGLPELHPLYLTRQAPPALQRNFGELHRSRAAAPVAREEAGSFAPMPAEVEVGLLSTTFTAPQRATIPSGDEPRIHFLASWPLDAELHRLAAPSVEAHAYLTGKALNGTGVPLPAGPVELYVEGAFVGRSQIAAVAPGEELKLAFGPDDAIRVERDVVERKRHDTGLFSKGERIDYRIRTTLTNHRREAVAIDLFDHLPVSRDEAIEVRLRDFTTPGSEEDPQKPGVRTWKLELKPGEKRVIEVGYEISFPRGAQIFNLP